MVYRRGLTVTPALVVALLSGTALADEMWSTNWGPMEYAEDLGPTAVFSYGKGALFIDDLGGNYQNRGVHSGYWIEYYDSGVVCDELAIDDYGNESWSWGYVDVYFIDPAFPSRWTADYSVCDGPIAGTITANPL